MKTLIKSRRITAILSFVLGTGFLAIHLSIVNLLLSGFIYTLIAIFINSVIFLSLLISATLSIKFRFELIKTSRIMLINIPIAFLYFYLVITLTSPIL